VSGAEGESVAEWRAKGECCETGAGNPTREVLQGAASRPTQRAGPVERGEPEGQTRSRRIWTPTDSVAYGYAAFNRAPVQQIVGTHLLVVVLRSNGDR